MDTTPQLPTDLIPTAAAARLVPGATRGRAVHIATVYRWIHEGRLRAWKVGGRLVVSESEVRALFRPVATRGGVVPPAQEEATRRQVEAETAAVLRRHGLE